MEGLVTDGFQLLPEFTLVHIQGPDAPTFLHGQLTHAVTSLETGLAAPAAYCMPQGRLLANGVLWRAEGDAHFVWMVSRDIAESLIKRLRMFVLRARVVIDLDESLRIWGALGAEAVPAELHQAPAWTHRLIDGIDWIVAPMSKASQPAAWRIAQTAPTATLSLTGDAWTAARLAGGWPCIRSTSQDQFLPASLDMDLNGTIDFGKGCYPGQEVIARSHYRGTVKRRMAYGIASWAQDTPALPPASNLYAAGDTAGKPVGRVIESAVHGDSLHVAAEITLSDWPAMRYAVGSPDGAVLDLQKPRGAG